MLNNNKTYDNSNLRDKAKNFNDGVVDFYEANERVLKKRKARFYFSRESISYETYLDASQNSRRSVMAIGIPAQHIPIEHGDVALINGKFYMVDHAQYKDYEQPNWYKVFLNETTIPYVNEVENENI